MNKVEKDSYNYLEKYIKWETFGERSLERDIKTILNLIEKQQKEIEYLKSQIPQDKIFYYSEKDYISKDKIKAIIEEITSYAYTSLEEKEKQDYAIYQLKRLLEE